jgi:hypothetical protein
VPPLWIELHHLPEQRRALQFVRKKLRPNNFPHHGQKRRRPVNWLRKKTPATMEPVIDRKALIEAQYQQAEQEYRAACKNLNAFMVLHPDRVSLRENRVFINVNHMANESPERRRLETIRREKLATRNDLLAQRAVLVTQGVHHAKA